MASRKTIKTRLAILSILDGLGVILLLATLWLEHNSPLALLMPTGPFAVGRMTAAWVDNKRRDPFAPSPAQPRELVVWLWYPAPPDDPARPAAYLPAPWASMLAAHAGPLLTNFFNRNPAQIKAHSLEGASVAPDQPTYPVVILRSGIGALALGYTTLAEDLASHGYIVVGADAPYSTSLVVMPDGRIIHKTTAGNPGDAPVSAAEQQRLLAALITVWSADTKFLLDQLTRLNTNDPSGKFTGRLDLGSVSVMGHSFGGDQVLVKSQLVLKALGMVGIAGDLDGRTALAYTGQYVRTFFDVHLRGAPCGSLYQAPLFEEQCISRQ